MGATNLWIPKMCANIKKNVRKNRKPNKASSAFTPSQKKGNYLGVSVNGGTPRSSILIGFSIRNHPFWGTTIFGNTHFIIFHAIPASAEPGSGCG